MIKKAVFIFVVCLFTFGCQKKSNEYYLYCGLEGYDKLRQVNEEFVEGYGVQKIAFFQEANQLQYVLMLTKNVSLETAEHYSLGLHVYTDKKHMPDDKKFLVWDTRPGLQKMGGHKYIINGFRKPIRQIDSLVFFLYDRDQYRGVVGNRIVIKNLQFGENIE